MRKEAVVLLCLLVSACYKQNVIELSGSVPDSEKTGSTVADDNNKEVSEQTESPPVNDNGSVTAVSVADYGAVGDGVTDDSAALNSAFQAIRSGGDMYFESGKVYAISRGIEIDGARNFNIYGRNATLRVIDGYQPNGNFEHPLSIRNSTDFSVNDLVIDGNRDGRQPAEDWKLDNIKILECKRFTFRNVTSNNALDDGFYLDVLAGSHQDRTAANSEGKFINCSADNAYRNGMSIIVGRDIEIVGGSYTNANGIWPQSGIDIEPNEEDVSPGAEDIIIRDATFTGNNGAGVMATNYWSGVERVAVENNYFSDNALAGVMMAVTTGSVSGNTFYNFQRITNAPQEWWQTAEVVSVLGENIVVENNLFSRIEFQLPVIRVRDADARQKSEGHVILNNQIYDFKGEAIVIEKTASGVQVLENDIDRDRTIPAPR